MKSPLWIFLFALFFTTIYGCGERVDVLHKDDEVNEPIAEPEPATEEAEFKFHTLVANIPSPLVTYEIMKFANAPYIKYLSNTLENRSRYVVESTKAMNFGIYMADFGYALLNDDNQKALKYYAVSHDIAKELGFGAVLDEVVNERLIANVGNIDSSKEILNDAYKALDKYLQTNDQLKTSGYILSGGWLQSQYIVLNVLEESESDSLSLHLQSEIYAQRQHVENLISFLIEYQGDQGIATLIEQLVGVKNVYDRLTEAEKITGDKLVELKAAIAKIRTTIIS